MSADRHAPGCARTETATSPWAQTASTACAAKAADSVIQAMEAEHDNWPQMGQASAATRGAEAHLLRAIRHVVIKDMLDLVR